MAADHWQNILDQHQSIVAQLETHASLLLDSMQVHFAHNNLAKELIQTRLVRTDDLIAFFKESADALSEISQPREPKSQSTPKEAIIPRKNAGPAPPASKPTLDPSGLFSVDTNPTPVDGLYESKPAGEEILPNRTKRRAAELEATRDVPEARENEQSRKRARSQEPDEVSVQEVDDSFDRGVEARLKAKEERKKSRDNKKRKRPSDASMNSTSVKGPKNKKQKQAHEKKVQNSTTPAPKPLETRRSNSSKRANKEVVNGGTRPNKKRKKSK